MTQPPTTYKSTAAVATTTATRRFGRSERKAWVDLSLHPAVRAAVAPTQNAVCERAGGAWTTAARAMIDEFNVDFRKKDKVTWLCAVNNWAANSAINETGYSPSQWVLGRGI